VAKTKIAKHIFFIALFIYMKRFLLQYRKYTTKVSAPTVKTYRFAGIAMRLQLTGMSPFFIAVIFLTSNQIYFSAKKNCPDYFSRLLIHATIFLASVLGTCVIGGIDTA